MTDELVKRLRSANDESFVETLCGEAADRIEQLTAERDRQYDENAHRIAMQAKAEAERDRLRAIGTEMAESIEGNYYLPGVATRWFSALKGETP